MWNEDDMVDLSGKIAIITGANSGIGYEAARALSSKNAEVIMACRSMDKGEKSMGKILAINPKSKITYLDNVVMLRVPET